MKMTLAEIATAVGATNDVTKWADTVVTSVAFDTRELESGALFVPLAGMRDGHEFLAQARTNGAVAAFWKRDRSDTPTDFPVLVVDDPLVALQDLSRHYLRKINPKVVAVTGSNGKTTTKDMVAAILASRFNVTKTKDNFNNEIGVPITILAMESNTEMLVVEMGMDRPGQLTFLSQLTAPDIAVITMIGEAHIEFFGTRDKIADAKMEIIQSLKADGTFIYDGDEPLLTVRAQTVDQQQVTFGQQADNDLYAHEVQSTKTTTSFKTNLWGDLTFKLPMPGDYNVDNALAALAVGHVLAIAPEAAATALWNMDLTKNRTEWVTGSAGEQILSDVYNSNPTAVKEVMKAFSTAATTGQRAVVLGDMLELGVAADSLHAELADCFDPALVSRVYLVGEHMKALYDALEVKYDSTDLFHYAQDEQSALIAQLKQDIKSGDLLLIKGSHGIHLENVLTALTA
ncbi:UDP-N-acetylmuramoyl-tripeptide--D-alanyl-D-alanine ligase [Secundilactobacillus kimchicus JCM 15530]|uniref:UDP-N-acetylmuramoyl-tripeptide--D-alanyl-D-alanine ligase n=1 Tax=Secundilactobacillus kimchicus JCM 15530 TaxID=1302272 RepID=A0A0R1HKI7_9LACO|nr:UDP-N-acetylmuramoyl-tripeptide--D-alanyl-D-alanine ligase [Secundilactobacillus kimchicus]KRK47020.1 UDP-N-acetylmuramoyl-tripeptide--D-alanyl-D-alanine ligase [Secundilactobacillus kimchicus JCM 15530]